jgi:hypothetical protein
LYAQRDVKISPEAYQESFCSGPWNSGPSRASHSSSVSNEQVLNGVSSFESARAAGVNAKSLSQPNMSAKGSINKGRMMSLPGACSLEET